MWGAFDQRSFSARREDVHMLSLNCVVCKCVLACAMGFGLLSCGQVSSTSSPTAPVASIAISSDLSKIDVCHAIPKEDVEAVMGRKLVKTQPFAYYETAGSGGCWYEAAKDKDGEAHFGYVAFTRVAAYYNNGADARQLWVKINDRVAMVVAFGDVPKEAGARALAELVLAAAK